mmetsp:Transcript_17199/g.33737  ORF Transcript_17199/g.33737 Transcript_17199/m.33737 type:complete len:477 (+) Transcript_17199:313-1743(+)
MYATNEGTERSRQKQSFHHHSQEHENHLENGLKGLENIVGAVENETKMLAEVCAQYERTAEARAAASRIRAREEALVERECRRREEAETEKILREAERLRTGNVETSQTEQNLQEQQQHHQQQAQRQQQHGKSPQQNGVLQRNKGRTKEGAKDPSSEKRTASAPASGTGPVKSTAVPRTRPLRRPGRAATASGMTNSTKPESPAAAESKVKATSKKPSPKALAKNEGTTSTTPVVFDQTFTPVERPPDYGKLRRELAEERRKLLEAKRVFMKRARHALAKDQFQLKRLEPRHGGSDKCARDQEVRLIRSEAKLLVDKLQELCLRATMVAVPEGAQSQEAIEIVFPLWVQFNLALERCEALKARSDRLARLETEPALSETDIHIIHFEEELLRLAKRAFKARQTVPGQQISELVFDPLRHDIERLASREVQEIVRCAAGTVSSRDLRGFAEFYRLAWRFSAPPGQDPRVSFVNQKDL